MRVPLALLADYALAHPDGKLYVTGGGIRSLPFAAFPATQPRLAIALGIEVAGAELGKTHSLAIEATGPTADLVVKPITVSFLVPPRAGNPADSGYVHFVSNMENVSFAAAGRYAFSVAIDGENLAELTLEAVQTSGDGASLMAESVARLNEGYAAFARGEIDMAEQAFLDVVARYPTEAGGHNNLGFVMLAKDDARGALASFMKARELGYPQPEINEPNIACALYRLGDSRTAHEIFQQCLKGRIFRVPATLYGIDTSGLFPVQLNSAADYVSLMTLNAAWSALKSGDRPSADRHLQAAELADLAVRDDVGGRAFAESLRALRSEAH